MSTFDRIRDLYNGDITRNIYEVVGLLADQSEMGPTLMADPRSPVDADTSAASLALVNPIMFAPTATRYIDITNAPFSMRLFIFKTNGSGFGIVLRVDGTWTTPYGLGLDYLLPVSDDYAPGRWEVQIDVPNKVVRVLQSSQTSLEPFPYGPVTASPGDTLDLFDVAIGVPIGGNQSTIQTGAPRSDGVAFMTNSVTNTRRIQDLGDGNGQELLNEPTRTNNILHSEDMYVGAAIQGTWAAENGTTGLGGQAGSPRGDATVVNLNFPAAANAGVVCTSLGVAGDSIYCATVWARCLAGIEKFRMEFEGVDGVVTTSADLTLTTTWKRYELAIGDTGAFNPVASQAAKLRFKNASDAAARTIQVWGIQGEIALYPTTYIKTVAATATRAADGLQFRPGQFPLSFLTRGISLQWRPQGSCEELTRSANGWSATMISYDGDGPFAGGIGSSIILSGRSDFGPASPFRYRATLTWTNSATGVAIAGRRSPPAIEFSRGQLLTLTFQQYRAVMKVEGATVGNGECAVAYEPVVMGTFSRPTRLGMAVGNRMGATNGATLPGGTYKRYITAA